MNTLGVLIGDEVLATLAARLVALLDGNDRVGRIGGDEFVAVIEDLDQVDFAVKIAEKVLAAIRMPVSYQGQTLSVGASIGIALFPLHGESVRDLFLSADAAMYAAKGAGKNCCKLAIGPPG